MKSIVWSVMLSSTMLHSGHATADKPKPAELDTRKNYEMIMWHSKKCLDVDGASKEDGTNVVQWECNGQAHQRWQFVKKGRHYRVQARHSGKCLSLEDASKENGVNLVQSACDDKEEKQRWMVVDRENGHYYTLESALSGKCLDIDDESRENHANVQQWKCNGGKNQRVKIEVPCRWKD